MTPLSLQALITFIYTPLQQNSKLPSMLFCLTSFLPILSHIDSHQAFATHETALAKATNDFSSQSSYWTNKQHLTQLLLSSLLQYSLYLGQHSLSFSFFVTSDFFSVTFTGPSWSLTLNSECPKRMSLGPLSSVSSIL